MIAHREAIHEGKRSNTINTYTEEDDVEDPPQNDIDENDYASTGIIDFIPPIHSPIPPQFFPKFSQQTQNKHFPKIEKKKNQFSP